MTTLKRRKKPQSLKNIPLYKEKYESLIKRFFTLIMEHGKTIDEIVRESGLSRVTVHNLMYSPEKGILLRTLQKLEKYVISLEHKA